jgi:hypothetical protein
MACETLLNEKVTFMLRCDTAASKLADAESGGKPPHSKS